jgi:nucleotide-binding universal stress UspA family protein
MATHGRTGLDRLTTGSVTADVVRDIEVPVVMFRPPKLALSHRVAAESTAAS